MGKHAIIVIKNNENKYLQYYDKKWNSKLFPNCKLDDTNNMKAVINKVLEILDVNENFIETNLIGTKKHIKFSESDKIQKEYIHEFYLTTIKSKYSLPDNYMFMSYDEMINDERIMACNSDIVGYIKEFKI